MIQQIKLLCSLQMKNIFGFNEFRYSKNRKKQVSYVAVALLCLIPVGMLVWLSVFLAKQLVNIRMSQLIPVFLYVVISVSILFLNVLKAGSILFDTAGFEILIPMPFSKAAIIISRFLNMYISSLALELLISIPAYTVYCVYVKPGLEVYAIIAANMIFMPLLPLTIASIAGALMKAIVSRMPFKSIGETVLMLVLVVALLYGSTNMSEALENISILQLINLSKFMKDMICKLYPPAYWFESALQGDGISFALLIIIPAIVFFIFVVILQKFYHQICSAIFSVQAQKSYKIEKLHMNSIVMALWKKELKRYFSSSTYVTQTIIGYVMAVVFAIIFLIMGSEKAAMLFEISSVADMFDRIIPFVLATIFSIISITSISISMEGMWLWQIQTLPVSEKQIYDSKILMNLTIAAPFYLISVIAMCMAVEGDITDKIWIIVIPAVYILFMSVSGLFINLLFPILNSDNEVRIAKQSASVIVTMTVGMLSGILPCVLMIFNRTLNKNLVMGIVVVLLLAGTVLMYAACCRKKLVGLMK